MKVICIGEWENDNGQSLPIYGEKYTVIGDEMYGGVLMYQLAEFPNDGYYRFTFEAEAFAPCDGPDEVDLAEARIVEECETLDMAFAEIVHEVENA